MKSLRIFWLSTYSRRSFSQVRQVDRNVVCNTQSNDNSAGSNKITRVYLRKQKATLVRQGTPLVYGGAVEKVQGSSSVGSIATIINPVKDEIIAWGVFHPQSMYRVRILQYGRCDPNLINLQQTISDKISKAIELRKSVGLPSPETNLYRLINSEGDGLSGITVDVLGECIVAIPTAAWVQKQKDVFIRSLQKLTGISEVVWRPNWTALKQDGIFPQAEEESDDDGENNNGIEAKSERTIGIENSLKYVFSRLGQKSGFYVDQRENRLFIRQICKGKSVLDLCCYNGGFAFNAAYGGASKVVGVDSSQVALDFAKEGAKLNQLDQCTFIHQDISDFLNEQIKSGSEWDIVILDPPKLAPRREVLEKAATKYRSINEKAMRVISKDGGLLMTCTCSGAMTQSGTFLFHLNQAAINAGRQISVIREAGCGGDHPIHPMYQEGKYLTNILLRVT